MDAVTDVVALAAGAEPIMIVVRLNVSGVLTMVGWMNVGVVVVTVVFVVLTVSVGMFESTKRAALTVAQPCAIAGLS